tara:strand:- start:299 stop:1894 length:1596 start_codon:yes stop_codon:yes gene_type:complete
MKNTILFFVLLHSPLTFFSQTFGWVETGLGNSDIEGKRVVADSDGNFIVSGNFEGSGLFSESSLTSLGNKDFFIQKYDSTGALIWLTSFGGFEDDEMLGMDINSESEVYVCGVTDGSMYFDTLLLENTDGKNGFLTKLNPQGMPIWTLNMESNDEIEVNDVVANINGNSYIVGKFKDSAYIDSIAFSSFGSESLFVSKISDSGQVIWVKIFSSQDQVNPERITLGNADEIYLTGSFEGNLLVEGNILSNTSNSDFFLIKLDSLGDVLWSKSAGGSDDINSEGLVVDQNGNTFLIGYFEDQAYFLTDTLISQDDKDGFLVKLDSSGNELWVKSFQGNSDVCPKDICIDSDTNVYVTGSIESSTLFDTLLISNTSGIDLFVAKFNNNGEILWGKGVGGTDDIESFSIVCDPFKNPVICGSFKGSSYFDTIIVNGFNENDFFISKIYPGSEALGILNLIQDRHINLYPNPTSEYLQIQKEDEDTDNLNVEIRDLKGRLMKYFKSDSSQSFWVGDLKPGTYFLNIKNSSTPFIKL